MEPTYPVERRKTRAVKAGRLIIGGGFPVSIQSMVNTDTCDVAATVRQCRLLFEAGCEIVRMSVLNRKAARCLKDIRDQVEGPLVADIHFDHNLALVAIEAGFDKVRINPGNIGEDAKVREVASAAKAAEIPIRIGVNSGSLPADLIEQFAHDDPRAYVEAALREASVLEAAGFGDIVISVKSSSVVTTYWAYRMLADRCPYPLHLGVTEAGLLETGTIKSSVGIGALLLLGIGDTFRVSLTADPVEEVRIAKQILGACQLRQEGVEVIACPTCGRTKIDLIPLAQAIERKTRHIKKHIRVAVMGCSVNGPGEARAADVGIAGGDGKGLLFKKGEIVMTLPESELEAVLLREIDRLAAE